MAPLKDRSLIEQGPVVSPEQRMAQLEAVNAALIIDQAFRRLDNSASSELSHRH